MGIKTKIDLVMDSHKFEDNAPSGVKYMFHKGYPVEVDPADVGFFTSPERAGIYEIVGQQNELEKGSKSAPYQAITSESVLIGKSSKTEGKSDTKKTKPKYDLDELNADEIIENDMFKKNPDGPWKCPVCGKKGILSKSGVRSHVGSRSCIEAARAK